MWLTRNAMVPNVSKTKQMFVSASNKDFSSELLQLKLNNNPLEIVKSERLLGLQVDQNLTWKLQVNKIIKKCNSLLYLLQRIKFCLDKSSRILFYNAYILPHLDYCCTVWGNCSNQLQQDIIKFQKRAARVILDKAFDEPSAPLFNQLKWMNFNEHVEFKKVISVYKSLCSTNERCPDYLVNKFMYVSDSRLRSSNLEYLKVPKPNLDFYRKSFEYSGAKLWNEIPFDIRKSESLQQFKNKYILWKFPGWVCD